MTFETSLELAIGRAQEKEIPHHVSTFMLPVLSDNCKRSMKGLQEAF